MTDFARVNMGCKKIEKVEVLKTISIVEMGEYRPDLSTRCCIEERYWDLDGKLLFQNEETISLEELDKRGLYKGFLG